MQFNSLTSGNAGDYAAAGKSVADSAAKTFAVQRKTGPDYAGLSQVAMQTSSNEKIASINASAKMAKAGIQAYSDVTEMGQKVAVANDRIDKFKKSRMAGSIAAVGKIAGAGYLASRDNTKDRPYPTAKEGRDGLMADHQSTIAEINKRRKASADEFSSTIDNAGNTTGGGTKPGKATNADGSLVSSAQALDAGKGTPGKGGKYNMQQMTDFAIQGGFSPENARTIAAIGMGESGGNAGIDTVQSGLDPHKTNEFSVGLSQINVQAHGDKLKRRGWTEADLRDPVKNMTIAKEVYDEAGSFNPWSVYKKGLHHQYLN
jgi:hypothetical protein